MRYLVIAAALGISATAAQAQTSAWGLFDAEQGTKGAGVQAADGSQLLLKCDKPGKYSVYATVFSQTKLVGPASRPVMSTISFRFDGGSAVKENWRFYEQRAVAVEKTNERSLSRFLGQLVNASKVDMRLEPEGRLPLDLSFNVTGAKEAIAQVYESCKDQNPVA